MNEARLLELLERIASALERLVQNSNLDVEFPFDEAEASRFHEQSTAECDELADYLASNPEALEAYEDSGRAAEEINDCDQNQYEADDYGPWGEPEQYGKYAGTYAQDDEGLSDDFIDDVLGGEPDAYWNID